MKRPLLCISLLVGLLLAGPAVAQERSIIATVNDNPVTDFDLKARVNLWKILGRKLDGNSRKEALDAIINDYAAIEETKKARAQPSPSEISERLGRVAKGLNTDYKGLDAKLKAQGASLSALQLQVAGEIAVTRLIFGKFQEKVKVDSTEVDAKVAELHADIDRQVRDIKSKIASDPRLKGVTVYDILEIGFPIDKDSMSDAMLSSRIVEAQQVSKRVNGCKSARSAATGVFNVRVGKTQQADGAKLPPPMKAELDKRGVGKAIGPFRSPEGVQLWVLCKKELFKPKVPEIPPPTYPSREQVEAYLTNQKVVELQKKYAGRFRNSVLVEIRDPAYSN
ncbi:MAG: hypothetical protein LCH46_05220 [Proteobacteria bacterium]|nr:hypothetical protein [Pseudomonadota bacterium]